MNVHEHELCTETHPASVDPRLNVAHCGECGETMPHEQHLADQLLEGTCDECESVYNAQEERRNSSY